MPPYNGHVVCCHSIENGQREDAIVALTFMIKKSKFWVRTARIRSFIITVDFCGAEKSAAKCKDEGRRVEADF